MNEICDHNDNLDKFLENIQEYGLTVILIQATDYLPSFGYTIGLWKNYNHPEIICFGLKLETLHIVLNDVADLVKSGEIIQLNTNYFEIFESSKAEFISVDGKYFDDYFGTAINIYGHENFKAIQLIWTDRNNKFPWEFDFEKDFIYKQPLLDRNVDFKFREVKNLATFTTRQWIEDGNPILRVVHDFDGDWQFLTGNQTPEDARIVALEELINRDKSLNKVFNLEYGESADRNFIGDIWVRTQNKVEFNEQ